MHRKGWIRFGFGIGLIASILCVIELRKESSPEIVGACRDPVAFEPVSEVDTNGVRVHLPRGWSVERRGGVVLSRAHWVDGKSQRCARIVLGQGPGGKPFVGTDIWDRTSDKAVVRGGGLRARMLVSVHDDYRLDDSPMSARVKAILQKHFVRLPSGEFVGVSIAVAWDAPLEIDDEIEGILSHLEVIGEPRVRKS